MRLVTLIAAALLLTLPTFAAAQVATPPMFSPDRIIPAVNAMVADKVAKARAATKPSKEGLAQIELAQMLRPDNAVVQRLVAYHAQDNGYTLRQYQAVLEFAPDSGMAALGVAELLAAQGYHRLAAPYFARAAATYPDNLYTAWQAGLNAYFAGDYSACVTYLDRALKDPASRAYDWFETRGECHASLGHKAQAKDDFERGATGDNYAAGRWSVRMFKDGAFNGCRGSADSRTASGIRERDKGDRYKAYYAFTVALLCDPAHVGALEGILSIEAGDSNLKKHAAAHRVRLGDARDGGQTSANFAKVLQPMTVEQMLAEAETMRESLEDKVNARRVVYLATRVLMHDPENVQALMLRAAALANLNIPALAPLSWDDATRVMKARPGRPAPHDVRGTWLERSGDFEGTAVELTLAIKASPTFPRYYFVRANAYSKLGRHREAVADMDAGIRLRPGYKWALMRRAEINIAAKNFPAAYADYQAVAALDTGDISPRVGMVRVADLMGDTALADKLHVDLLRSTTAADESPYLRSRDKPFLAQVQRERSDTARSNRQRSARGQYDDIRSRWSKVTTCHGSVLGVVTQASRSLDSSNRSDWKARIDQVSQPCYALARTLSTDANRFRQSPEFAELPAAGQAFINALLPQIDTALSDLMTARRTVGLSIR